LFYNQLFQSSLFDIGKKKAYIRCKNEIENTIVALKKIFEKSRENNCDSLHDFLLAAPIIYNLNDVNIIVKIQDEDSKININQIVYPDGKINNFIEKSIRNILKFYKLTEDWGNAFIDWIDADNITLPGGAENDYYSNTVNKLLAPNNYFSNLDELKLLKNLGGYFEKNNDLYLGEYFTIYSDNKYNINTVSDTILKSFELLDNLEIEALMQFRKKFQIKDINNLPDLIPELQRKNFEYIDDYLKVKSDIFNIEIIAKKDKYIFKCIWLYNRTNGQTIYKKYLGI